MAAGGEQARRPESSRGAGPDSRAWEAAIRKQSKCQLHLPATCSPVAGTGALSNGRAAVDSRHRQEPLDTVKATVSTASESLL